MMDALLHVLSFFIVAAYFQLTQQIQHGCDFEYCKRLCPQSSIHQILQKYEDLIGEERAAMGFLQHTTSTLPVLNCL